MKDRLRLELELVEKRFGDIGRGPNMDWFILKSVCLDAGWNKERTRVLILLPGGYATTPPDNFYADADLRLANGSLPGNASENQQAAGGPWTLFSYHIEDGEWKPGTGPHDGHNLVTFVEGVLRRLQETS